MSSRPRAVITTPFPTPAATARILGVPAKRFRELREMVTEALARFHKGGARKTAMRRRSRRS
jgi:hypothetical protein